MPVPSLVLATLSWSACGKIGPLAVLAFEGHMLRAVGIVEVEQRALRKDVG